MFRKLAMANAVALIIVILASPALSAPPSNDNFVDAILITGLPFVDETNTDEAIMEVGEPQPSPACAFLAPVDHSVWYKFTPSTAGDLTADTFGSNFDTVLAVYTRVLATSTLLVEVACNDQSGGNQSRVNFEGNPGTTFYFQITGWLGDSGDLKFKLQEAVLPSQPLNDDFSDATPITDTPFTDAVDTRAATLETLEPDPSCGSNTDHSVWYEFTPTTTVTVDADTLGSNFDTVLAVYTGDSLTMLTQVACNDDSGSLQSRIRFDATSGVPHYFQISGWSGASGDLDFELRTELPPVPPSNDDFADAAAVALLPFSDSVNTREATLETGEPAPSCGSNTDHSVWYEFTPTTTVTMIADTFGSNFDTVLAVYTGSGLSSLTEVTCNDQYQGNQSKVILQASGAETYYLQISGWFGSSGDLTFNVAGSVTGSRSETKTYLAANSVFVSCPGDIGGDTPYGSQGGACFDLDGNEFTADIEITDTSGLPVGAYWQLRAENGTPLSSGIFCESGTFEVPAGAARLLVWVDGPFGPLDCFGTSVGVGTTGTIRVDFATLE